MYEAWKGRYSTFAGALASSKVFISFKWGYVSRYYSWFQFWHDQHFTIIQCFGDAGGRWTCLQLCWKQHIGTSFVGIFVWTGASLWHRRIQWNRPHALLVDLGFNSQWGCCAKTNFHCWFSWKRGRFLFFKKAEPGRRCMLLGNVSAIFYSCIRSR